MPRRKITWVAVADGGRALILINEGSDAAPLLMVLAKDELDNPRTREQGTDRPGRRPDPGVGQRSAMETTDWHALGEARFVRDFAGRLNRAAEQGRFDRLVLAAPPKVLGQLRPALSAKAADRLAAEIGNDLTGLPVDGIEQHLSRALAK
jgi:protein required for attachment to host cells